VFNSLVKNILGIVSLSAIAFCAYIIPDLAGIILYAGLGCFSALVIKIFIASERQSVNQGENINDSL
jgi:uncharacterized membrane protein YesL